MSDKLGTVIGLLIGATLIIFGIIWPDHLSNYYLFQLREFEMTLDALTVGHGSQQIGGLENQSVAALAPANDHDGLAGFSVLQTIH